VPSPTLSLPRRSRRTTEAAARLRLAVIVVVLVLATAAVVHLVGCRAESLPVLGTVPPFSFTERGGGTVSASDLAGHVWIADFVFTRCPDFCPALTSRMAALQHAIAPGRDPVRLVSFTVDPAHDTPEALRDYATRAGAGDTWLFLTGPRDALAAVLRDGFKVAYADDGPPASPITHSDRFVLVDPQLRIRGYYHGTDPADVARLARDAAALRDGRAS